MGAQIGLIALAIATFGLFAIVLCFAGLMILDVLLYSYKGQDTTPPFEIPPPPDDRG